MEAFTNWFKRITVAGGFKYVDGELLILNTPNTIIPVHSLVLWQYAMEQECGKKKVGAIIYNIGKIQAQMGLNQMLKRFGFKKDFKFLQRVTEQPKTVGLGNLNLKDYDAKEKIITFKSTNTPFAKRYRALFGQQKEPVDHFIRGTCAGAGEIMFGEDTLAVEKVCMAQGKEHCLFEVKPLKNWDKKSAMVKEQYTTDIKLLEQKGDLSSFLQKRLE